MMRGSLYAQVIACAMSRMVFACDATHAALDVREKRGSWRFVSSFRVES
jgi:hypothetical protein